MEQDKVNPRIVQFLAADVPKDGVPGRQAIELDADVLELLNIVYRALNGKKPKRRILNDVLRAAFSSDALNEVIQKELA